MSTWIEPQEIDQSILDKFPELPPVVVQLLHKRNLKTQEEIDELIEKTDPSKKDYHVMVSGYKKDQTMKEVDQLFCRILGFKHEGVLKQAVFKDGVYHDVYQHALLRENYKKP